VELSVQDRAGRIHIIRLSFTGEYPNVAPSVEFDLPISVELKWREGSKLATVIKSAESAIESLQPFWDVTDDLDNNTHVIEPKNPTFGATQRRLALGKQTSVQVVVDPLRPKKIPECRFFGSEKVIGPLNDALTRNTSMWDHDVLPRINLGSVLGIAFPTRPEAEDETDGNEECGICYSDGGGSGAPVITCEDARCVQRFHQSCLVGWLQGLPSTRSTFDALSGECPYCCGPITCVLSI